MTNPLRVTWRRPAKKLPPEAIVILRGTQWGNPFEIGTAGVPDNATAVRLHREWFISSAGQQIPVTLGYHP